jgi:hypothetical protein
MSEAQGLYVSILGSLLVVIGALWLLAHWYGKDRRAVPDDATVADVYLMSALAKVDEALTVYAGRTERSSSPPCLRARLLADALLDIRHRLAQGVESRGYVVAVDEAVWMTAEHVRDAR